MEKKYTITQIQGFLAELNLSAERDLSTALDTSFEDGMEKSIEKRHLSGLILKAVLNHKHVHCNTQFTESKRHVFKVTSSRNIRRLNLI